jgi:hypothetical protein
MRTLARGRKRSRPFRGEVGFLRKGIQMKRFLAFALIAVIGMFVIGCGDTGKGKGEPKGNGTGFHPTSTKTPAPGTTEKKP